MEFRSYQKEANTTDQYPGAAEKGVMIPLLGLAGEVGSLLTEYKKRYRDGEAYRMFRSRLEEEMGDILWYLANIAEKADLNLEDVAKNNLAKIRDRWEAIKRSGPKVPQPTELLDEGYPDHEVLPRNYRITLREVRGGDAVKVVMELEGEQFGDDLTDNAYEDDGYRFHDVFHLAYMTILGWSPVIRHLSRRKRKSVPKVDEVEDGARARVIEEAISALVFEYGRARSFFDGVQTIDSSLLYSIKDITSHLEVQVRTAKEWEKAILKGYAVWRGLRELGGGVIVGDLRKGTFEFEAA